MSSFRSRALSVVVLASLLLPSSAHAQTVTTAPDERPGARTLIWTGASIFAASYLSSAIGATTSYDDPAGTVSSRGFLWIPMAGPFMLMGSVQGAGWDTLLALDGAAQIGGLALFVAGVALKHLRPRSADPSAVTLTVSPLVARGASGAALSGTF